MTTNRMGLEQTLSDEQLEELITELELCGIYGRQVRALAELQEFRKASKGAVADVVAWNKPGEERKCDIRWRRFDVAPGPLFEAPPLQAVTVPDKATWRDAPVNSENVDWAAGWNACRALMLKSVTNEP